MRIKFGIKLALTLGLILVSFTCSASWNKNLNARQEKVLRQFLENSNEEHIYDLKSGLKWYEDSKQMLEQTYGGGKEEAVFSKMLEYSEVLLNGCMAEISWGIAIKEQICRYKEFEAYKSAMAVVDKELRILLQNEMDAWIKLSNYLSYMDCEFVCAFMGGCPAAAGMSACERSQMYRSEVLSIINKTSYVSNKKCDIITEARRCEQVAIKMKKVKKKDLFYSSVGEIRAMIDHFIPLFRKWVSVRVAVSKKIGPKYTKYQANTQTLISQMNSILTVRGQKK